MAKNESNCCGDEQSGEQACECLPQALEEQVTPNGTRLLAVDRERTYRTGDGSLWLSSGSLSSWPPAGMWTTSPGGCWAERSMLRQEVRGILLSG